MLALGSVAKLAGMLPGLGVVRGVILNIPSAPEYSPRFPTVPQCLPPLDPPLFYHMSRNLVR